jgi:hypothetical protein
MNNIRTETELEAALSRQAYLGGPAVKLDNGLAALNWNGEYVTVTDGTIANRTGHSSLEEAIRRASAAVRYRQAHPVAGEPKLIESNLSTKRR